MNDRTAADWLTSPQVTEALAKTREQRNRYWRIVDATFDAQTTCVRTDCGWLSRYPTRSGGESLYCTLRDEGTDPEQCPGVEEAIKEESEE